MNMQQLLQQAQRMQEQMQKKMALAQEALAKAELACMADYTVTLASCRRHLQLTPDVPRPFDVNLERWRLHFSAHADESRMPTPGIKDHGFSTSLLGLDAICYAWYCEDPSIRDEYPASSLQYINDAYVFWATKSSRHTLEAKRDWPSGVELKRFKRQVCAAIVHHWAPIRGNQQALESLQHKLLQAKFLPAASAAGLNSEYEERRMPPELAAELEQAIKKAHADIAAGKKDVKLGVSAEHSGTMWREQPEERVLHFPFQMARFLVRVDNDESLLARLHPQPAGAQMRFSDHTWKRVLAWMQTKLRMEPTDQESEKFRNRAIERALPLGWETERYRSRKTVSDRRTPIDSLGHEIGADLSSYLSVRLLLGMRTLVSMCVSGAGGIPDMVLDSVFLTLWEFHCGQSKFAFEKQYVITDPHTTAALERLLSTQYMNKFNKLPVMVSLCNRWWLSYKAQLWPCGTEFIEAALSWLEVLRRDFTCPQTKRIMTEQVDDLTKHVALFLREDSVLPPPLAQRAVEVEVEEEESKHAEA